MATPPTQIIEFEGVEHEFPSDFSDAEIASALKRLAAPSAPPSIPGMEKLGGVPPGLPAPVIPMRDARTLQIQETPYWLRALPAAKQAMDAGAMQIPLSGLSAIGALTNTPALAKPEQWFQKFSEKTSLADPEAPPLGVESLVNTAAQGVGSSAPFMALGMATGGAVGAIPYVRTLAPLAQRLLKLGLGAASMTTEVAVDAGSVYSQHLAEAKKAGANDEAARLLALETVKLELPATAVSNVLQMLIPGVKGLLPRAALGMATNAGEETLQQLAQIQARTNRELPNQNIDEQVIQSAVGGGAGGLVTGALVRGDLTAPTNGKPAPRVIPQTIPAAPLTVAQALQQAARGKKSAAAPAAVPLAPADLDARAVELVRGRADLNGKPLSTVGLPWLFKQLNISSEEATAVAERLVAAGELARPVGLPDGKRTSIWKILRPAAAAESAAAPAANLPVVDSMPPGFSEPKSPGPERPLGMVPLDPVEVPESGTPESVTRGIEARENVARQLGVDLESAPNSVRIAIDDLVSEGLGYAPPPAPEAPAAPAPPVAEQAEAPVLDLQPTLEGTYREALAAQEATIRDHRTPTKERNAAKLKRASLQKIVARLEAGDVLRGIAPPVAAPAVEPVAPEAPAASPTPGQPWVLSPLEQARLREAALAGPPLAEAIPQAQEAINLQQPAARVPAPVPAAIASAPTMPAATLMLDRPAAPPAASAPAVAQAPGIPAQAPEIAARPAAGAIREVSEAPRPQKPEAVAPPAVPAPPLQAPPTGASVVADAGTDTAAESAVVQREPPQSLRTGNSTTVLIPGSPQKYPVHYAIVELAEIQASHNGVTFAPNPSYQAENERNYTDPANQERVVNQASPALFEPRFLVTDNPDALNGPPVIDPAGDVVGGNSRTMTLHRVYSGAGELGQKYRDSLATQAPHYGFTAEQVGTYKQPVLVRALTNADVDTVARLIRETNQAGTAALTPAEQAIADAKSLAAESIEFLQSKLEAAGPEASLRDVLAGPQAKEIVQRLVDDNVFTVQEKPNLLDGKTGALTEAAKTRIEKMFLGRLFRDSNQFARTPPAIRNKLEKIVAYLGRQEGKGDWDLKPAIQEAIDLIETARTQGVKILADLVAQQGMFGDAPWSPRAVALADVLNGPVNPLRDAFKRFTADAMFATDPSAPMFGAPEAQTSFAEAFGGTADQAGSAAEGRSGSERGGVDAPSAPSLLEKLDAAGKEASERLRQRGIISGGNASMAEFLNPETIRDMAVSIAGDVARGVLTLETLAGRLAKQYGPRARFVARDVWAEAQRMLDMDASSKTVDRLGSPDRGAPQALNEGNRPATPGSDSKAPQFGGQAAGGPESPAAPSSGGQGGGIVSGGTGSAIPGHAARGDTGTEDGQGGGLRLRNVRPDSLPLFSGEVESDLAGAAAADKAALLGDQLTAGFNAPLSAEEKRRRLKPSTEQPQTSLFEDTPEAPQSRLFGGSDPGFFLGSGFGGLQSLYERLTTPKPPDTSGPAGKADFRALALAHRKSDMPDARFMAIVKKETGKTSPVDLTAAESERVIQRIMAEQYQALGPSRYFNAIRWIHSPSFWLPKSAAGAKIWESAKTWFFWQDAEVEKLHKRWVWATEGLSKEDRLKIGLYRDTRQLLEHYGGDSLKVSEILTKAEEDPSIVEPVRDGTFLDDRLHKANDRMTSVFEYTRKEGVKAGFLSADAHFDSYLPFYSDAMFKLKPGMLGAAAADLAQELGIPERLAAQILDRANAKNVKFGSFDMERLGWLLPGMRDPETRFDIYSKGFARKMAVTAFLKEADPQYKKIIDPELKALTRDYINQYAGRPLGNYGPRAAQIAGYLTAAQYVAKLGYNAFSPLLNITQIGNTFAQTGTRATLEGLRKGAPQSLADTIRTFPSLLFSEREIPIHADLRNEVLLKRGGVAQGFQHKFERPVLHGAQERLQKSAGYLFTKSEYFNRAVAFFAAVHQAEQEGVPRDQAVERARDVVGITQFYNGRLDAPLAAREPLGRVLMQFKTFTFKEIEFVRQLPPAGKWRFAAATAVLGGPASLGITGAIKFFWPDDPIPDFIKQWQEFFTVANLLGADRLAKQMGVYNVPQVENLGRGFKADVLSWAVGPTISSMLDTFERGYMAAEGKGKPLAAFTTLLRGFAPGGTQMARLIKAHQTAKTPKEFVEIAMSLKGTEAPAKQPASYTPPGTRLPRTLSAPRP